jgi:hypothetical protein
MAKPSPISEAIKAIPARPPKETLPCGHTKSQAAWLGCTEDECRPQDAMISRQYAAQQER